jgi:hypothetical protein
MLFQLLIPGLIRVSLLGSETRFELNLRTPENDHLHIYSLCFGQTFEWISMFFPQLWSWMICLIIKQLKRKTGFKIVTNRGDFNIFISIHYGKWLNIEFDFLFLLPISWFKKDEENSIINLIRNKLFVKVLSITTHPWPGAASTEFDSRYHPASTWSALPSVQTRS